VCRSQPPVSRDVKCAKTDFNTLNTYPKAGNCGRHTECACYFEPKSVLRRESRHERQFLPCSTSTSCRTFLAASPLLDLLSDRPVALSVLLKTTSSCCANLD
jgi:hypothetical protein